MIPRVIRILHVERVGANVKYVLNEKKAFHETCVVFSLPFHGESQICDQEDGGYFEHLL